MKKLDWSIIAVVIMFIVYCLAVNADGAEPKKKAQRDRNYILRRQSAYQVQGPPVRRLIIGKREVDIYRDGSAFEKDRRAR
jgi:hypothetical protein